MEDELRLPNYAIQERIAGLDVGCGAVRTQNAAGADARTTTCTGTDVVEIQNAELVVLVDTVRSTNAMTLVLVRRTRM